MCWAQAFASDVDSESKAHRKESLRAGSSPHSSGLHCSRVCRVCGVQSGACSLITWGSCRGLAPRSARVRAALPAVCVRQDWGWVHLLREAPLISLPAPPHMVHAATVLAVECKNMDPYPILTPVSRRGNVPEGLSHCRQCRGAQACVSQPKGWPLIPKELWYPQCRQNQTA